MSFGKSGLRDASAGDPQIMIKEELAKVGKEGSPTRSSIKNSNLGKQPDNFRESNKNA